LVAWLVEVRNYLGLYYEVLYLTVNIIDRSLSLMEVTPDRLMLLGAALLIISLKYEQ
ncbi:cyclin domain-containing protein, partial [Exophiala aquamarina CBS 119918]